MSKIEGVPAPFVVRSSASVNELWRSPIATLPLWPIVLLVVSVLFVLGPFDSLFLSVAWLRGIDLLLIYSLALVWWGLSIRRRGHSVSGVMGARPSLKQWRLTLVATLAAQCLCVGWLSSLAALDLVPAYWSARSGSSSMQTAFAPIETLAVVVLGPCAEEILFRGIIFRRSLRWMSPLPAALWSSLVFGLCHYDMIGAASFGLVLVGLYVQSGSLWAPIAAHCFFNATAHGVGALVAARGSLGWAIAGAQLVCVPWLVWFSWRSLRQLEGVRDGP